jgi:hypothetical protein
MILLQTLSRLHVCATLALAQMVGSIVAIVARATAPDKNGPGGVFPNPSLWDVNGTGSDNPLAVSLYGTSPVHLSGRSLIFIVLVFIVVGMGILGMFDLSDHHYHWLLRFLPKGAIGTSAILDTGCHYEMLTIRLIDSLPIEQAMIGLYSILLSTFAPDDKQKRHHELFRYLLHDISGWAWTRPYHKVSNHTPPRMAISYHVSRLSNEHFWYCFLSPFVSRLLLSLSSCLFHVSY